MDSHIPHLTGENPEPFRVYENEAAKPKKSGFGLAALFSAAVLGYLGGGVEMKARGEMWALEVTEKIEKLLGLPQGEGYKQMYQRVLARNINLYHKLHDAERLRERELAERENPIKRAIYHPDRPVEIRGYAGSGKNTVQRQVNNVMKTSVPGDSRPPVLERNNPYVYTLWLDGKSDENRGKPIGMTPIQGASRDFSPKLISGNKEIHSTDDVAAHEELSDAPIASFKRIEGYSAKVQADIPGVDIKVQEQFHGKCKISIVKDGKVLKTFFNTTPKYAEHLKSAKRFAGFVDEVIRYDESMKTIEQIAHDNSINFGNIDGQDFTLKTFLVEGKGKVRGILSHASDASHYTEFTFSMPINEAQLDNDLVTVQERLMAKLAKVKKG